MPSLANSLYEFGEFRLDAQNRVLRLGEEPIALTPKAFEVLLSLIQHSGEVVSKDELMQAVWPDSFVEESNLTQTVFMLRKALGETPDQRYILTVQGRGYRLAVNVKTVSGNGHAGADSSVAPEHLWMGPSASLSDGSSTSSGQTLVHPPTRNRLVLTAALIILITGGLLIWRTRTVWRRASAPPPLRSIAVLPLENFSGDSSQDYFVDGMTDELITDLAKVSALRVTSRTSVMRYKGTKKSLPEIARELNVDGVVEGSVTRSGNRVRITAQLLYAPSDQHLWADTYERDLGDVLKLQSEVAQAIAQQVRVQVTPDQQARLRSARPVNPEAYEAYLKGRYYLTTRFTMPQPLNMAKSYFEEAIRKDPDFALGYSGLADSYVWLALFGRGQVSTDRAYQSAKESVRKALELDNSIGQVHDTLGMLSWRFEWNWDAAEREFNQAVALAPSYSCAHEDRAVFLSFMGRRAEALAGVETSKTIDPSPSSAMTEAATYYQLRDYQALTEASRKGLTSNPNEWTEHANLGIGYEGTGKLPEAISEYQKAVEMSNGDYDATASLAHAYAVIGRRSEAKKILRDLEQKSQSGYVSPYVMATIYSALGEKDRAFEFLERAYQERSLEMSWHLKADLRIDNLRSDPRFQNLVRRVGLAN
jgi:TolB-like protein/DNA-binding winged helix-turn-helix (wHTH) protein/Flp pilus assembly protein TadD